MQNWTPKCGVSHIASECRNTESNDIFFAREHEHHVSNGTRLTV